MNEHIIDRDKASMFQRLQAIDWPERLQVLFDRGHVILPDILSDDECREAIDGYAEPTLYRKTVNMARHRFGKGEYKYFSYPLPLYLQTLRTFLYPHLAAVANLWSRALQLDVQFPTDHAVLREQCREAGQLLPTPLILKYGPGGHNTLHQDLYGDVYFPLQAVCLLSDPEIDFSGGEFVLVEQYPRAQSKALVLPVRKGDMLIFTTRFRPEQGSKGYYRVNVRHGVSEIHQGNRYAMGIIFHDAVS